MQMSQLKRPLTGLSQFISKTSTQVTEGIKRQNSKNNFKTILSDDEESDIQRLFLEEAWIAVDGEKIELDPKICTKVKIPKGAEYILWMTLFPADDDIGVLYFEETVEHVGKRTVTVLKMEDLFKHGEKKTISCPPKTAIGSMMSSTKVTMRIREKDVKQDIMKLEFIYE
jgi:hypothetical protein